MYTCAQSYTLRRLSRNDHPIAIATMSATMAMKAAASMSDISHTLRAAGVHAIIEEPSGGTTLSQALISGKTALRAGLGNGSKGEFLLLTPSFCRCESAARASIFTRLSTSLRTGHGNGFKSRNGCRRARRARFVTMAKQCLAFPDINEWESKFLDSLIRGNEMMGGPPEQLSLRQAERLLSIRDEYELHSELHGV